MIDSSELERLKKICEVAIAENWVIEFNREKGVINVYANSVSDAAFIAESPMVISKLIAEIESLKADKQHLRSLLDEKDALNLKRFQEIGELENRLFFAKEALEWIANDGELSPEGYMLSNRLDFVNKATEALSKINGEDK